MSKLVVEIKSKDMVKPSSPTPNHLKILKLSSIDQFSNPVWMPFIYYYNQRPVNKNTTTLLKKSLSETLVQFYPLAGRIEGNLFIDCNDEGVPFYEANVSASLAEVIENPNFDELIRLLPFSPLNKTNKRIVAGVQVNHFSCGSIAISLCASHKIADASSSIAFANAWANNARGSSDHNAPQVKFLSESFFPQIDPDKMYDPESDVFKEKTVEKRLVFDKEKIDMLRKQCIDGHQIKGPTRVEAISAFLWKQFIKAARTKPKPPKIFGAVTVVSLRKIKSSPIPQNYYGNLIWSTSTHAPVEAETKYSELVDKLRTAVKQIDKNYIKKIQTGESYKESQRAYENLKQEEADFCFISDCSRFPVYEVDFGWGKPIWVSHTTLPFKNTVFLLSTKCGEGIEAWVSVLEQDIAALERDHEFLSLASHNIQARL